MFNNSSQFPHENFEQFKQLKFVFENSPPKQQSPVKPQEQSISKTRQKSNPSSKQQPKSSLKTSIPSHSFGSKKNDKSPERSSEYNFQSNGAMSQSFTSNAGGVRLQDLCPEDKQKIGELIKKLAEEKEEKEKLKKELESKDTQYKGVIENLKKENEEIVKDSAELQNEFKSSLNLLKSFQESTSRQRQKSQERRLRQQEELQMSQSQHHSHSHGHRGGKENRADFNSTHKSDNLTMSALEPTLREKDEPFSPEREKLRQLKHSHSKKDKEEQPMFQERASRESKPPKNRGNVIDTLKKEQKTIDEISKLKEDIEGLAYSFKKINFSPAESFGPREVEVPRGQVSAHQHQSPSPIRAENYNTKDNSAKLSKHVRDIEEDESPFRQPQFKPQKQENYDRSYEKGLESRSNKKKKDKKKEESNSSSDEDEVAIAQKWMNLRKQKIQQINNELYGQKDNERREREQERHEMREKSDKKQRSRKQERDSEEEKDYYREEEEVNRSQKQYKQKRREEYEDEEEERNRIWQRQKEEEEWRRQQEEEEWKKPYQKARKEHMEQRNGSPGAENQRKKEYMQYREGQVERQHYSPTVENSRNPRQQYPQQRFEQMEEERQIPQGHHNWRKSSPPVREVKGEGQFFAGSLSGNKSLKEKIFSKQEYGNESKFEREALSPSSVVNINEMSVEDLVNLKNMLDQRISNERTDIQRDQRQAYRQSPPKVQPPLQKQRSEGILIQNSYVPDTTISPKNTTLESYSPFIDKSNRSGLKTLPNEDPSFQRRMESTIHSQKDGGMDYSLMRDFQSIGHITPAKTDQYMSTDPYRLTTEGVGLPLETPPIKKSQGNEEMDYETLFEEKLKEFLRVRERMIKANKIPDNIDIEEMLKNTLMESKRTNETIEPNKYLSTQKYTYTNSPVTTRSFGRPEAPKLSSRDLVVSQASALQGSAEQVKHPLQNIKYIQELPVFGVDTLGTEQKSKGYEYKAPQPKQFKEYSPKKKQMEQIEALGQLADDFYDDGLFDLVDDLDKKESNSIVQSNSVLPESRSSNSRMKDSSSIDDEFKSLFSTVKTMFNNNDDTTTDRIREQVLGRAGKLDRLELPASKVSYEDDGNENENESSRINLPERILNMREPEKERRTSGQRSSITKGRASKADSSAIETDMSILAINKKVNDMKKKKKPMKF